MSVMDSTISPPWMDKKFLELWLKAYYGDVTVTECEVQKATSKGDNYLSDMQRLVVRTKSGDSYPLIIKCKIEKGTVGNMMRETNMFNKEKEMYCHTLPRMTALLQNCLSNDSEPLGATSFNSSRSFVVLEDLTAAGFRMMERRHGLDLDHCLLVMRGLGRFHATSVVLHQQDPAAMEKYSTSFFCQPSIQDGWSKFCSGMARILAEELETWSEEWWSYSKNIRDMSDSINKRTQEITLRNDSDFNVLAHGDLWTNNIMFRVGTSSVRFVDYQWSHFTSPAIDLHYFITTSANDEVRVNHIDRLLQVYHTSLCDTLVALGYTQRLITLEELHNEFDRKMIYGLFSLITACAVMRSETDSGFSFDEVLDTGKTPGPSMYNDNYRRIVKWFLPLFKSKGVFDDN